MKKLILINEEYDKFYIMEQINENTYVSRWGEIGLLEEETLSAEYHMDSWDEIFTKYNTLGFVEIPSYGIPFLPIGNQKELSREELSNLNVSDRTAEMNRRWMDQMKKDRK